MNDNLQLLYNGANYYVLEYLERGGLEIVNKSAQTGGYIGGKMAQTLKQNIFLLAALPSYAQEEQIQELIQYYDTLISYPSYIH